ncbi:hypothetical protein ANAEL_00934 [Anaerolineales bacterium]|nr:hypothetical protein ANAEL_00934 [Anaerolineales bacterium]
MNVKANPLRISLFVSLCVAFVSCLPIVASAQKKALANKSSSQLTFKEVITEEDIERSPDGKHFVVFAGSVKSGIDPERSIQLASNFTI